MDKFVSSPVAAIATRNTVIVNGEAVTTVLAIDQNVFTLILAITAWASCGEEKRSAGNQQEHYHCNLHAEIDNDLLVKFDFYWFDCMVHGLEG